MELNNVKEGMILKDTLTVGNENILFEKGTILSSEHINLLKRSGLAEIDVIPLPDISKEHERQIYQSYIKLDFCFSRHKNNPQMLQLKNEVKDFMYYYLDTSGGKLSDG